MLESARKIRDSSVMVDDPLSDVLKLVDAQSVLAGGFTAGGSWALRFLPPVTLKFFALLKGECWLIVDGEAPVNISAGDVLLMSTDRSYVLAGDVSAPPVEAREVFDTPNKTARIGEGDDCIEIGGHVLLSPASGRILRDALPPIIHVRSASKDAPTLRWLLSQLLQEQQGQNLAGSSLATTQLAQLMFLHVLRFYLATAEPIATGWLRVLADPRLAPALRLMHGQPERAWTLPQLAKASGMSRTTFAVSFKAAAGVAPLTYLTQWRMQLAEKTLRHDDVPISILASRLGYGTESAFSNAFKRVTGKTPSYFRRRT